MFEEKNKAHLEEKQSKTSDLALNLKLGKDMALRAQTRKRYHDDENSPCSSSSVKFRRARADIHDLQQQTVERKKEEIALTKRELQLAERR